MGASALVVAAAFAVAFAVLMSTTSNDTVEAATLDLANDATSRTAAPGDTVRIAVNAAFTRVSITDKADGVGASFAAGGGQSVACSDDGACDVDDDPDTSGQQNRAGWVSVALKIDADSGTGHILLSIEPVGGASPDDANRTKVVTVSKAGEVGSIAIEPSASTDKTIPATSDGTAHHSNLTVTVKNAASPAEGLARQDVSIITTHGTVACSDTAVDTAEATAPAATDAGSQTCNGNTAGNGEVLVVLVGGGVEGKATITARLGTRTATTTVTLFGTAKNLDATPQQDSVEIGGSVFVVLTVTDGAGNPVAGQVITPVGSKEVVGPTTDAVKVTTSKDATPDTPGDGSGYNVDYIATKAADSIPACGDDKDPVTDASATPATTEDFPGDGGTNAAGKCVVEVKTQKAAGTTKATSRGEHTLNFAIGTLKASTTIEVAGAPASITTDAPETVDPGSVTEITVSVWDDEDVLVGITSVKVRRVDGGGLIEDESAADTPGSEKTVNGKSKFTFIAPSSVGMSEILISAGKVDLRVPIQIGTPEPEPEPVPEPPHVPALSTTPSPTGVTLVTFNGGSVAELSSVLTATCGDGARAYATDYQGNWVTFIPSAPSVVNAPFNALFSEGIPATTPLLIGNCGG